ncbi:hypothetical protein Bca52824_034627 [Brassica carinata]|uniref:Disease resistance protein n=1 Tax=Brassica carinata TaxID=52824 RepID=A0A8X7UZM9_BRACI|nr:hypothetical protein Bca52824_034627 [Brassica carinata]
MFRCRFREVSYNVEDVAALPSLQEIDIDHCYYLDELPDWFSEVVSLKKLSITNCGKALCTSKGYSIAKVDFRDWEVAEAGRNFDKDVSEMPTTGSVSSSRIQR